MDLRKPVTLTRQELLQTSSAAIAAAALAPSASAAPGSSNPVQRLSEGWEYYRGNLGSIWEAWRGKAASDNVAWDKVGLPHCFNALDSVDPDHAYYQGPGGYRTTFAVQNPFPNGRTLLRFEGAGQLTDVFVGLELVATHAGDYDEWTVDITDAAARSSKRPRGQGQGRTRHPLRQLAQPGNDPVGSERLQPLWRPLPPRQSGVRPRYLHRARAHRRQ